MKKFYVIGNKTSKSLSPTIFNYWFKKYEIKAKYDYIELNKKNFNKKILEILKDKNTYGLNVTIPFKQNIIKYIKKLDKHAKEIKAVNCVTTKPEISGSNTDWDGYYKSLPKIKYPNKKKVLLIGYGGAALAIHYVLKIKGFKNIIILNRTKKKLHFEKELKYTKSIKSLNKYLSGVDMIINTTPTNPIKSTHHTLVDRKTILSDIVYTPKETAFLDSFPGYKKVYGITMLTEQAAACFKLWFGFKPDIDKKLLKTLDLKTK